MCIHSFITIRASGFLTIDNTMGAFTAHTLAAPDRDRSTLWDELRNLTAPASCAGSKSVKRRAARHQQNGTRSTQNQSVRLPISRSGLHFQFVGSFALSIG